MMGGANQAGTLAPSQAQQGASPFEEEASGRVASCGKACHAGECSAYAHRYRPASSDEIRRAARLGKHAAVDQDVIPVTIDGVIA